MVPTCGCYFNACFLQRMFGSQLPKARSKLLTSAHIQDPEHQCTFEIYKDARCSLQRPNLPLHWSLEKRGSLFVKDHSQQLLFAQSQEHSRTCLSTKPVFLTEILIITQQGISEGWDKIQQGMRNKLMHSKNGNTRLVLFLDDHNIYGSIRLNLYDNLFPTLPILENNPEADQPVYTRNFLLLHKPYADKSQDSIIQTTTQFHCSAVSAVPSKRTGRRRKNFLPNGHIIFRKVAKHKPTTLINNSRNSPQRRPPPPRGAPGAPTGSHEECPTGQVCFGRNECNAGKVGRFAIFRPQLL